MYIDSISASCYILLGIDYKLINHNKINIIDIIPNFNE